MREANAPCQPGDYSALGAVTQGLSGYEQMAPGQARHHLAGPGSQQ